MTYRIFVTGSGLSDAVTGDLDREKFAFQMGAPEDNVEDLTRKLSEFNPHGLIVRQGRINAEVQDAAPNLKVICKHGAGVDNIDIEAATRRKIPVFYTPGATTQAAAEHALGLILGLLRQIPLQDRRVRTGVFSKSDYQGRELAGKTLGIVGFGRIGRRLCDLVAPFNVKVLVFHPSGKAEELSTCVTKVESVMDVFRGSDIVTLHCPLTAATTGMVNADVLSQMKPGAYLVNTARGPLVNEEDLVNALRAHSISGAGLDCFEKEPLASDNPLLTLDNVVLTAHVAGASDASLRHTGKAAIQHIENYLEGKQPDLSGLLNPEILTPGIA